MQNHTIFLAKSSGSRIHRGLKQVKLTNNRILNKVSRKGGKKVSGKAKRTYKTQRPLVPTRLTKPPIII